MPASDILTNLYIEYTLHRRHPIWGISKKKKIVKDEHKTVSCCPSESLSPTVNDIPKPSGNFSA